MPISKKLQEKCLEIEQALVTSGFTLTNDNSAESGDCFHSVHAYPDSYVMRIEFDKPGLEDPSAIERQEKALEILADLGVTKEMLWDADELDGEPIFLYPIGEKHFLTIWLRKDKVDELVESITPRA